MHRAFGEPLAVLAGDALIVLAFETLARGARRARRSAWPPLLAIVGARRRHAARHRRRPGLGVRAAASTCADYQRAKTGALFAAATMAGARRPGADPAPWRALGDRLGEAYQVADDIRDVVGDPRDARQAGRPRRRARPPERRRASSASTGAVARFDRLVAGADRGRSRPAPAPRSLRALMPHRGASGCCRRHGRGSARARPDAARPMRAMPRRSAAAVATVRDRARWRDRWLRAARPPAGQPARSSAGPPRSR